MNIIGQILIHVSEKNMLNSNVSGFENSVGLEKPSNLDPNSCKYILKKLRGS